MDGISYRIEASTSLEANDWDSSAAVVEWFGTPVDNGDGTETVTCRIKDPVGTPGSRRFVRLAVEELGE